MIDLGVVRPGSTIRIPFSSFDKDDGSSITMTNFAAADILIYKDGSTTERASTSGFTATTDLDGKTGKHVAIIDLADDTTADFFKSGSEYLVAIDAVTVDGVTTGGWIARFRIGYPGALLDTSIATLASQTSFTLTSGPAEDDALNGHEIVIHDKASAVQVTYAVIEDYTGATKTVTLRASPAATFTIAAGDNVSVRDLVRVDVSHWLGAAAPANTGDAYARLGAPAGASVSADVAAIKSETAGISTRVLLALPAVAPAANGGLPTGDASNRISGIQGTKNRLDDLNDITVAAIWDALTSGMATVGSIGKKLADWVVGTIDTYTGNTKQTGDAFARLGAPSGASVSADVAGVKAETASILAAATDLQARTPAALTAGGNMKSDALAVNGSTQAAARLALSAAEIRAGTVDHTGFVATTTEFESDDVTEAAADFWNGALVQFTSGALRGQKTSVTDYALVGGRGHFTVPALTSAPADNVTFVLI